MFAYIDNDAVVMISAADVVEWQGITTQGVRGIPPAERKKRGIYDFIAAGPTPKYHQAGGTTYAIDNTAGTVSETVEAIPFSMADAAAALKADLAALRYQFETAGITVAGAQIKTDRESQAQLNGVFTSLQGGLIPDTPWKSANGWVQVTLAQIQPIAQAVSQHVRACFANEKSHCDAIDAIVADTKKTVQDIANYNISTGWPGAQQ